MSESSSSVDEIVSANGSDRQGLKYLHHWPPVNLAFDDVVYSVNNGVDSEYNLICTQMSTYLIFQVIQVLSSLALDGLHTVEPISLFNWI